MKELILTITAYIGALAATVYVMTSILFRCIPFERMGGNVGDEE